jgi:hypothetical protein
VSTYRAASRLARARSSDIGAGRDEVGFQRWGLDGLGTNAAGVVLLWEMVFLLAVCRECEPVDFRAARTSGASAGWAQGGGSKGFL